MIISHKHKFIFMHSRKCAGSTVEVMLNKFLGPNDIQIGSWPETIRAGGKVNRRFITDAFTSPISIAASLRNVAGRVIRSEKISAFEILNSSIKRKYSKKLGPNPSCPIAAAVIEFSPDIWSEYFKFAFVRNPFDFEVSDYFWRTKSLKEPISFKEFLQRKLDVERQDLEQVVPFPVTNWPIYTLEDKLAVDYIGRFEKLESEVKIIGEHLGLRLDISAVPKAKSTHRKLIDPEKLYDEECKDIIRRMHEKEIEYFGYSYPY